MIRAILVVLFVAVFLILSLPIQLVLLIIGKFNPMAKKRASLAIVGWAFNVVAFLSLSPAANDCNPKIKARGIHLISIFREKFYGSPSQ